MPALYRRWLRLRPSLSFTILLCLLAALLIGGGASRADALGQAFVRGIAWLALIVLLLFSDRPTVSQAGPVAWLLLSIMVLAVSQLVPLPPELWQILPGREPFVEAAAASGQPQPWRALSIVPASTVNAAASLVVPVVTFALLMGLRREERRWLPGVILCLVTAASLIGLLQFSGWSLVTPLVNNTVGQVAGIFANRNHFALFLATGCLLAPVWMFAEGRAPGWRLPVGLALLLLFAFMIIAVGSRAGLLLGLLGQALGLMMARRRIMKLLRRYRRWVTWAVAVGVLSSIAATALVSVAAGRSAAFDRVLALDEAQDMRHRGLPIVLKMIGRYFPAGSGFGTFDPVFRMHEPFDLLELTYFNHAHNDLLEVVLDGGIAAVILLLCGLGWWIWASAAAWRVDQGTTFCLPRCGSAMLLLIILASAFDYPVRTPIFMAITVIAGVWLSTRAPSSASPALPHGGSAL